MVSGYPDMSFDQVAEQFHDKANKEFKSGYQRAGAVWDVLQERHHKPIFSPESHVFLGNQQAIVTFYDVAFLSEAEVVRLTGLSAKALSLGKPKQLLLEDGVTTLNGYFCSIRGLPAHEVAALRKVRFEHRAYVRHDETLMSPAQQIRKEQGNLLYELAARKQEEKLEKNCQPKNRGSLPSLADLKAKANNIIQEP